MTSPPAPRGPAGGMTSGGELNDSVDAIRYAVLRKLAPGLRHALMGELQGIELSSEFAARALHAGVDLQAARDSVARISRQCRDAAKTGRSLVEWLSPDDGVATLAGTGVGNCLKLVGEDWPLRAIEATIDLPEGDAHVSKAALNELVVTAILVLTDMHDQPVDLHVTVRPIKDHVDIVLGARPVDRVASMPPIRFYRKLVWADLELLASPRGIPCVCEGTTASLQFPRVTPARERAS